MNIIEIVCDNISKSYSGKSIFKNLNLKISSRESLTITGRNGTGKSTLIKVLSNLVKNSKGRITVRENGKDLNAETWFLRTGLLTPYYNLYDELTGSENLRFFYELKLQENKKEEFINERVNFFLHEVSLYDKRNELVKNYSSGMKQRLKLAFAVINEPEILFMDEPRTNLDKYGIEIMNRFAGAQKEKGILIIATNDEDDKQLCDRTLNIEDYR
ncbi:MAG: ABC transporter ATP-binding protein [Ignavibacteria bacterium]|nr:ABC transporter ATP-binding protein [Ignavibacteria bacterium]